MASGFSKRHGSNKLFRKIEGKTLIEHAFDAVPEEELYRTAAVTRFKQIADAAGSRGITAVMNEDAEKGISSSVKKGIYSMSDADGIVFSVADQPYLRRETVKKLVLLFKEHPENIIVPVYKDRTGNPCIFPSSLFGELCALEGDTGGKSVIKKHPDMVIFSETDEKELTDIDFA